MSKELPKKDNHQEFDVFFVFSMLEKAFKKLGEFFSNLFSALIFIGKKCIVFVFFFINLVRANLLTVFLAGIVGFSIFYFLEKTKPAVYNSNMLLKQNFETGKVLYRSIANYSALANSKDSVALSEVLNIPVHEASFIKGISISHNANKNFLMKEFLDFQKMTDSTTKITYEEYLAQKNLEDFPLQTINLYLHQPVISENLANNILDAVLKNKYFENLKNKEIEAINRKKELLNKLVVQTDTFQAEYFDLLKNYYRIEEKESKSYNSTVSLNLDNKKDKITTKEYELFLSSKALKLEINEIEDQLKNKDDIFIIQKVFSSPFRIKDEGTSLPKTVAILFIVLVILILLIKELSLIKVLDEVGTKENLFEKKPKK